MSFLYTVHVFTCHCYNMYYWQIDRKCISYILYLCQSIILYILYKKRKDKIVYLKHVAHITSSYALNSYYVSTLDRRILDFK